MSWRGAGGLFAGCVLVITAGCSGSTAGTRADRPAPRATTAAAASAATAATAAPVPAPFRDPLPGMPVALHHDVYAATRAGMLSPQVARATAYVYVPDSKGSRVTVIDQRTLRVVRVIHTGYLSQHVVPSYDLHRLYVNASAANELVTINPDTARKGRTIKVPRPYNLYFTPDGRAAVVMVEQHNTIRFSDPHTFAPVADVRAKHCQGPNHADFSANGRFLVATCEFSGALVKVDTTSHRVQGVLRLGRTHARSAGAMGMSASMPQDVRLSPDGTLFYVADMGTDEVRLISAATFRQVGAIATPSHPHGLYPSRDGRYLYVSDRGAGKVSVVSFATHKIVATWTIPGGGSPDMGGVSADGRTLWLSGRFDGVVYAFDTTNGKLRAKIKVGGSPHGLAVWPQPGRYSLGHTGNMR